MINENVDDSLASTSANDESNEKRMSTVETTDVTKWSSADVLRWIEEQSQKFELKKATTEKFQMNGNNDTSPSNASIPTVLLLLQVKRWFY